MKCRDIMAAPHLANKLESDVDWHGGAFPVGRALLTPGYALPAEHVLHCVGPCASYHGQEQPKELARCYTSCLETACAAGITSVAFCCISTGVFGYPAEPAARVALSTVKNWIACNTNNSMKTIVFNVFTDNDFEIYSRIGPQIFIS
jgi:O-acetyl-ADP-ribose deacetylase (regulator of RNase III)